MWVFAACQITHVIAHQTRRPHLNRTVLHGPAGRIKHQNLPIAHRTPELWVPTSVQIRHTQLTYKTHIRQLETLTFMNTRFLWCVTILRARGGRWDVFYTVLSCSVIISDKTLHIWRECFQNKIFQKSCFYCVWVIMAIAVWLILFWMHNHFSHFWTKLKLKLTVYCVFMTVMFRIQFSKNKMT